MGGTAGGEIHMNSNNSSDDELPVYAVRLREYASRDINAETVRLAQSVSDDAALAWYKGLIEAIGSLATLPRRCPRVPERFHIEMRQLLYQRPGSRVKHRIFFSIAGEAEGSLEPPTVVIFHVRHGAARSLTQAQLRQIEAEE